MLEVLIGCLGVFRSVNRLLWGVNGLLEEVKGTVFYLVGAVTTLAGG